MDSLIATIEKVPEISQQNKDYIKELLSNYLYKPRKINKYEAIKTIGISIFGEPIGLQYNRELPEDTLLLYSTDHNNYNINNTGLLFYTKIGKFKKILNKSDDIYNWIIDGYISTYMVKTYINSNQSFVYIEVPTYYNKEEKIIHTLYQFTNYLGYNKLINEKLKDADIIEINNIKFDKNLEARFSPMLKSYDNLSQPLDEKLKEVLERFEYISSEAYQKHKGFSVLSVNSKGLEDILKKYNNKYDLFNQNFGIVLSIKENNNYIPAIITKVSKNKIEVLKPNMEFSYITLDQIEPDPLSWLTGY